MSANRGASATNGPSPEDPPRQASVVGGEPGRTEEAVTDDRTKKLRGELAWLLYALCLPAGEAVPDALPTAEFALWEVKARGILSLIADDLTAAGWDEAAQLLDGTPHREHGEPT